MVEFTWDNRAGKIVGAVTVTDGKTELRNTRSDDTNCPPPKLNGEYEHFQSVSTSMLSPDRVQIKGTRTYPAAMVSNLPGGCSMRAIPGAKLEVLQWVAGMDPQVLAMPNAPGSPVKVSADRKSFSTPGAENWTWTYTPTRL